MGYKVELTEIAAAEIDGAYEWIKERAPDAAQRWYDGLMAALSGLGDHPRRCPRVLLSSLGHSEVRQLVYGRRRGRYCVLFTIHGDTVEILRVRHGARAPIRR